jgi:fucokinase
VNGLIGGAKSVSCDPSVYPLKLQIEKLAISDDAKKGLDERLMLCFTGKTRLAKSLLQNVLRRWSAQTTEIHDVVESLVVGAKQSRDALLANDIEALGECLSAYWELKKLMAGSDSGVEPLSVSIALNELTSRRAIVGASLCGAGGGGFLVLLRSTGTTEDEVHRIVAECLPDSEFVWCRCAVSDGGLRVAVEG